MHGDFVKEYVIRWSEDTRTEEWLENWDSMTLIGLRDATFGDLDENSWTRWVEIAAKAIHNEPSGSDPLVKCYGTLMKLSWDEMDEISYERHYEESVRTALGAVLPLASFAATGLRIMPGWCNCLPGSRNLELNIKQRTSFAGGN